MSLDIATEPTALAPSSPLDLLAMMVERGADPSNLERMMALAERYQDRQALAAYQAAMAACQNEMPAVVKSAENSHTRSRYALVESVVKVAKPVYTKHGFSLSFYEGETPKAGHFRIVVDIMHSAGHKETKWMDLPIDGTGAQGGKSSMNAVQGVGSSFSYGQRYLTCKIFNIQLSGEDDDGNQNGPIGPNEIEIVNKLIESVRAANPKWEFKAFLRWLGCESLEEMNMTQFGKAVADLNSRRKRVAS